MRLRILRTASHHRAMNMAIDEAVMQQNIPTLRFYTWEAPSLSIGYFQKISEINTPFLDKTGIGLVRRITGGKAVLHGKDLTYSIILPEKWMPDKVTRSYEILGGALFEGLQRLGLPVKLFAAPEKRRAPANCFQTPGWFEISVRDRKIAGSAQLRRNNWLLQQGSIMIDMDYAGLGHCFTGKRGSPGGLKRSMTTIMQELGRPAPPEEVAECLEWGFKKALSCSFYTSPLTEEECTLANKLKNIKYNSYGWNFHR